MSQSQINRLRQRGLANLRSSYPCTVSIGGVAYEAVSAGDTTYQELTEGGFEDSVELMFRVSKVIHPLQPVEGAKLIYSGKTYRITRVSGVVDVAWTIRCSAANR